MPRTRGRSSNSDVEGFVARFDPPVATLVRRCRAALRRRWPTAVELIYDNYNALAIGFGSTDRMSDVFVSLAVYARGVNLYFMYGVELPDPDDILEGTGNRGRFVRLASVTDLERPDISALLDAAVRNGDTPLRIKGLGHTVIKSVSKKQRSRRPRAR
jgi:hypothetical protein